MLAIGCELLLRIALGAVSVETFGGTTDWILPTVLSRLVWPIAAALLWLAAPSLSAQLRGNDLIPAVDASAAAATRVVGVAMVAGPLVGCWPHQRCARWRSPSTIPGRPAAGSSWRPSFIRISSSPTHRGCWPAWRWSRPRGISSWDGPDPRVRPPPPFGLADIMRVDAEHLPPLLVTLVLVAIVAPATHAHSRSRSRPACWLVESDRADPKRPVPAAAMARAVAVPPALR